MKRVLSLLWLLAQSLIMVGCGFAALVLLFIWFLNLDTIRITWGNLGNFVLSSILSWLLIIGYLLGLRRWWPYANAVWYGGKE